MLYVFSVIKRYNCFNYFHGSRFEQKNNQFERKIHIKNDYTSRDHDTKSVNDENKDIHLNIYTKIPSKDTNRNTKSVKFTDEIDEYKHHGQVNFKNNKYVIFSERFLLQ